MLSLEIALDFFFFFVAMPTCLEFPGPGIEPITEQQL